MPISSSAKNLLQTAWKNIQNNNISVAISACRQINQLFPQNAEGWYVTSYIAFGLGDGKQSLIAIERALALDLKNILWQIHRAKVYLILGQKTDAAEIATRLAKKQYKDVQICGELALILNKLQNYSAAEDFYQQAIKLSPNDSQLYFNLASIQRYLGHIEDTEFSLNKAIELDPKDFEAYWLRSSLRKQTSRKNHIEELKKVLVTGIKDPIGYAQICYALAKEEEDLKLYSQSFQHLHQGADYRRENMRYVAKTDLQIIDKIIQVFDSRKLNGKVKGHDNEQAIFILGLPRTGSTLVERIISSHDQVYTAGELNDFAVQMMTQCRHLNIKLPKSRTALVELTGQLNFASLGQAYIQSVQPDPDNPNRFVDKLPLNSLYTGLIHLALPKAKIIHVQRHPLDTCYSIYKQLFTNGYPFSYDLTELAEYYIANYQLMQHWKNVMPGIIHTVGYEKIVNNVELEAKKLIAYCGLEWQNKCSQFHLNKTASITASATQVRQSIYSSSMGQWRHFEEQLQPVKSMLERVGIICD